MSPRLTSIALLFATVLLIAGCGGGGDGDEGSTESTPATTVATKVLSKAELLEQGNAICAETMRAIGTSGANGESSYSVAAQVGGLYAGMVSSLKDLGKPKEANGYAKFFEAADELAAIESELKLASEREDRPAVESAELDAERELGNFRAAAAEYGLEDCNAYPTAPETGAPSGGEGEAETGESPEGASEAVEPEAVEPEAASEEAPETGGAGGTAEGGGAVGAPEGGGETGSGGSGGGIGAG